MRRVERAGLAAMPARTGWELPGWVCLADGAGFVGRANAATPVPHTDPVPPTDVARAYVRRGLTPTIRWTPEAGSVAATELAGDGWRTFDETLVMTRRLAPGARANVDALPAAAAAVAGRPLASTSWRALYASQYRPEEGSVRLRLALDAPAPKRYAEVSVAGLTAGVGLAVAHQDVVGVFDVYTDPARRRAGIARSLVTSLLAWGVDGGAELAYLQVSGTNDAAIALYRALGFDTAYTYVYARPPSFT